MESRIFVWSDVHDKSEQPWEAPSREEAWEEVRRLQRLGHKNAGYWDTSRPWPFDEREDPSLIGAE